MLRYTGTLIAAAAFLFSLVRSPVRALVIAALLTGLWWYHTRADEGAPLRAAAVTTGFLQAPAVRGGGQPLT